MSFEYPLRNRDGCLDDPALRFGDLSRDIREYCLKPLLSHDHCPDPFPGEQWCRPRLVYSLSLDEKYRDDTKIVVLRNGDFLILSHLSSIMIRWDLRTGRETPIEIMLPPLMHPHFPEENYLWFYYDGANDELVIRRDGNHLGYPIKNISQVFSPEVGVGTPIDMKFVDCREVFESRRVASFPLKYPRNTYEIDFMGKKFDGMKGGFIKKWSYYGGYLVLFYWRTDHWEVEFHQCLV